MKEQRNNIMKKGPAMQVPIKFWGNGVFPHRLLDDSPGTRTLNPLIKSQLLCQLS